MKAFRTIFELPSLIGASFVLPVAIFHWIFSFSVGSSGVWAGAGERRIFGGVNSAAGVSFGKSSDGVT